MHETRAQAAVQVEVIRCAAMTGVAIMQQQAALHDTNLRSLTDQQRTQADMRMTRTQACKYMTRRLGQTAK